ncbi:hypothetical protein [Streptosporangium sp. NPDC087985]|uniref:hypothetical protein n=1 Tax=Streptosporangium sp. NPDC087985 TaxID=3366196 RepID=UPI00382F67EA
MTAPIGVSLGLIRRGQRISQQTMADHLGVAVCTVGSWDRGHRSPPIGSAVAYAAWLDRRLVLLQGSAVVAEGEDIIVDLAKLRRGQGVSRPRLAHRLFMTTAGVRSYEVQICSGSRLDGLQRYVEALGYHIGIAALAKQLQEVS